MAQINTQLTRLYLQRLVSALVPPECDLEFIQGLVNDIIQNRAHHTTRPLNEILDEYRANFNSLGKHEIWRDFQRTVDLLINASLPEYVADYLSFARQLMPQEPAQRVSDEKAANFTRNSSPIMSDRVRGLESRTMAEVSQPYVSGLDPKLFATLLLALTGQETEFLLFLNEPIAVTILPSLHIGTGSTALLTDILEAGLLFRSLSIYIDSTKGGTRSPIKAAFIRFIESYLLRYANEIDALFQKLPDSLIQILNSVQPHTKFLRLLSYLKSNYSETNGFLLLSKAYDLSQFGDPEVAQFSTQLFHEVVKPYFQYIEHWVIKGELIDENSEFFVYFDKAENHVNDIIRINPKLLPKFLQFEEATYDKILHIGKTLIFLDKYCKELAYINGYVSRYYHFIFKVHAGMATMKKATSQLMISTQYEELTNFFAAVIQSKMHLFLHLFNLKQIMFSEAGDFIDTISQQGHSMFSEPAAYLTPSRLSDLLINSISSSSVKNLPTQYLDRIDARILDLSHGTIGWDVFTLEYKISEILVDALLNYRNQLTEYLRLFNFLWGLRHFTFLLQQNFLQFQRLNKSELRTIRLQIKSTRERPNNFIGIRARWILSSVKKIDLFRHKILMVLYTILHYVSEDLIEKNFYEEIVKKMFRLRSVAESTSKGGQVQDLPILNQAFRKSCQDSKNLLGCEVLPRFIHNVNDCTMDDILRSHRDYFRAITGSKLLRENMRGKSSGESLVDQVYGFLEVSFSFVQACDQFEAQLTQMVTLLKMESLANADEEMDENFRRLESLMHIIYREVYLERFIPKLDVFRRDLRQEPDLRDLSKSL